MRCDAEMNSFNELNGKNTVEQFNLLDKNTNRGLI